jgi:membrane-associated phospholipid phosphatase
MIREFIDELSHIKAHVIYGLAIFIACLINIFFYYQVTFQDGIEIAGTFIQIALPCYVLVPILVKKDWEGMKKMLLFLAAVLIVTHALKWIVPIKRPYGGSGSFPSGHTAGAFLGCVFLSFRYGKIYFLATLPLAIFVAYSRVYTHNHWPTDVFAAIILCFTLGAILIPKWKE